VPNTTFTWTLGALLTNCDPLRLSGVIGKDLSLIYTLDWLRKFRVPLSLATAFGVGVSSFFLLHEILSAEISWQRWALRIMFYLFGLMLSATVFYLIVVV
jgi:hypothetical protein